MGLMVGRPDGGYSDSFSSGAAGTNWTVGSDGGVYVDGIPVEAHAVVENFFREGGGPSGYVSKPYYNREGLLPKQCSSGSISYAENDIMPLVDPESRGLERVVVGRNANGEIVNSYYTDLHYQPGSFTEIDISQFPVPLGGGEGPVGGSSEPFNRSGGDLIGAGGSSEHQL
jgi:guanyl-specific ribonuclease Sa